MGIMNLSTIDELQMFDVLSVPHSRTHQSVIGNGRQRGSTGTYGIEGRDKRGFKKEYREI